MMGTLWPARCAGRWLDLMLSSVAADMNTDGKVMGWIFDEYTKFAGYSPGQILSTRHLLAQPQL